MYENIVLVGMSGAGKSTLGVLLAKSLAMDFLDTDILIQKTEGKHLQKIIDTSGVQGFLAVEENCLYSLDCKSCVIATGGSAVYSDKAMKHLKNSSLVVYLSVEFDAIKSRLDNIKSRGIVMQKGEKLEDVYTNRLPLYKKYADITVDCTKSDIEHSVGEIISAIKERENQLD